MLDIPSVRLIAFDLDGTLIDSVPDLASAVDYSLNSLGLAMAGEDRVRSWLGNGAAKLLERALLFRLGEAAQVSKYHAVAMQAFFDYYRDHCAEKTRLYPGVSDTLDDLFKRGLSLAIVTNKPRSFVPSILNALDIDHYFSCVVCGDDLAHKKPHPEPLLHCMAQMGCDHRQTLMVGDSVNDTEAARRANVLVAAVNYGYNHGRPVEDEQPDFVLTRFSQLTSQVLDKQVT